MFYEQLLGSCAQRLKAIDVGVGWSGAQLGSSHAQFLVSRVSQEEIEGALRSMDYNKMQGCDGLNLFILKQVWSIVGDDVV